MNVLFNDAMTVYNYYRDTETGKEMWHRSMIKGIQWSHNKSEVSTSNGVQTAQRVERITIDMQKEYGNKCYLPPNEYKKLSSEECKAYWTLDTNSGQDVLVLGIADKEISRQYRLAELSNDYQYVVTVTAVSDNRYRQRLKHIKVVGK